jgi:hypothetical protein
MAREKYSTSSTLRLTACPAVARAVNDANNSAHPWMIVSRGTGTTVSGIAINDPVTINSSLNILPASGSLTQGLAITQNPAGTISSGTFPSSYTANYINVASDTVNSGDGSEFTALAVVHKAGGPSVLGQRYAFHAEQWLTAATGAETQKDMAGRRLKSLHRTATAVVILSAQIPSQS